MMLPGRPLRDRRWAAPALAVLAAGIWAALAAVGALTLLDAVAGALAAAAGLLAAGPLERALRRRALDPDRPARPEPPAAPRGDAAPDAGAAAVEAVSALLRRLAPALGAVRLVIWEHDAGTDRLAPVYASHRPPDTVPAAGDPVAWALRQGQPLRLEGVPGWAVGPTTAAPLTDRLVLTAEGDQGPPDPEAVADAAAIAGDFLALGERERRAAALASRFERLMAFLEALPAGAEAERFPDELARALGEMADADGAVVAAWHGDRGQVLATWGTGGGPAPGTYFGVMDGDLAMAARAGAAIRRDRTGRPPILAHAGERWARPPRHLCVVPLVDASGTAGGVCAFWGGAEPEDAAIQLVRALGPMLALQLRHSTDVARFRQSAHEDALTGLRNRAALEERLVDERNRFHRYRRPLSLLVLDLDHFKRINDTWGHPAGDAVLQRVADIVRATIREADVAFRFGGEEMVVLLPETMLAPAADVAERIRRAVGMALIEWGGHHIPVTLSVGVSCCPEAVDDPDRLLKSADQALYASKNAGRNRVTVAQSTT